VLRSFVRCERKRANQALVGCRVAFEQWRGLAAYPKCSPTS
jgi:hypothetical protein